MDGVNSKDNKSDVEKGVVEITLYALLGSPSLGTMRVKGRINVQLITILIDTSSTHNFLDTIILATLQLSLDPTLTFEVKVANGATIQTNGVRANIKVLVQGYTFTVDLNVLPLGDYELVLGTQWLRTLGMIQWDFRAMFMKFQHMGTTVTLEGLHPIDHSLQEGTQFFKKAMRKASYCRLCPWGLLLHLTNLVTLLLSSFYLSLLQYLLLHLVCLLVEDMSIRFS